MRRRSLLGGIAGIALTSRVAAAATKDRGLVVESIEVSRIRVNHRGNWLLLRTKANNGLTGLGDASHGGDETAQLQGVQGFFPYLAAKAVGVAMPDVKCYWRPRRSRPLRRVRG